MKKYLWLILIISFAGMKAESGWEDFGTYKKQKLQLADIKRFHFDKTKNIFFTFEKSGIVRKFDFESGKQIDTLVLDSKYTEFFFSNGSSTGVCLSSIIDTLQPILIKIIDLENWQAIRNFDSIMLNKIFTLPIGKTINDLGFDFADYFDNHNLILGIKANTSYVGDYTRSGETFGKLNLFVCGQATLTFSKEILKEKLKNSYYHNNNYYFTEYLSYSFVQGSYTGHGYYNSTFKTNTVDFTNQLISTYRYQYFGKYDVDNHSGYYRSIDAVMPTADSDIVLLKLDNIIQVYDIYEKKAIDSMKIENYLSIVRLFGLNNNLISLNNSNFDIYDINFKIKLYSIFSPILADDYRIIHNNENIICWNTAGEMINLNIYPTNSFSIIKSDKYYANPSDEIKLTFFTKTSPLKVLWDFGDGNFSNEKYPIHKYQSKGKYRVKLTITDSLGYNYNYTDSKPIQIKDKLKADFKISNHDPKSPSVVNFTNKSSGEPTNYKWTTSQLDTSINQNPIFTFISPGYHTVKLVIRDEFQVDSIVKKDCIVLDSIIPDTFKLVKEYNIPNIFENTEDKDYAISEIVNSKIMVFSNEEFLLHLNYKSISSLNSAQNYFFNIFGLNDKVDLSSKLKLKDTKDNYKLLANSASSFLISKNYNLKTYNSQAHEITSLDILRNIKVAYAVEDTFFLVAFNSISIFDNSLKLLNTFYPDYEPIIINGISSKDLEIIGLNNDSIYYQEIKNSSFNQSIKFFKQNNFYKNLNYKFLSNDKIAIFGTIIKSKVELGYLSIYNKKGEVIAENEYKDIIQITDIDTIDGNTNYLTYKSRFKTDNGIILLDKEFSRTNKVCYFDLDTSFKQISVKRYKDNSFFFLGYSNNAIGIKPIFLLLEMNSKPSGIADSTDLSTYSNTSIFPNPATDFISINNGEVHNLKIYDVKGIEFDCKTQIYTNIIRINISELQTGIYVVRYELNGKIYNEKFVKI